MSLASLSGISAITSSVAGLMSSRCAFVSTNCPPMKLASRRKKLLGREFPTVDIRIPRIPRHDRRHAIAQIRRDRFRHDERFLSPQLVWIAEFETEDAEDVAG